MYWTLDTRPPTLDEIVIQGLKRMRAAVEAVCDAAVAPSMEVPQPIPEPRGPSFDSYQNHRSLARLAVEQGKTLMPGQYIEIMAEDMEHRIAMARMAAQRNTNAYLPYCAQGLSGIYPDSPFYTRPRSLGTLTEFE